jgi:N-methylhydantoinase A/oxoprolinase/acetone carboxylase beta subunit
MIMKGDGGVTDIDTFKNKPILTILSGPAASVAGALLYSHILHGVFIEIGGTSTNISIIKNGKCEIRYVSIMDHPTCIRSVDVRVAGVAGGSLIRISNDKVIDVGPRSAHIAGLRYSCFVEPQELENARIISLKPNETDPDDYVCIETANNKKIAITNTCAANALGLINKEDYAFGNQSSAIKSLSLLGKKLGVDYQTIASMILDFSIKKILHIMEPMIKEYHLDENKIILVGGGGGASVLVPYMATKCKFTHEIAKNAEVVSSIGVAAAMIYEEIEKTIDKPESNDVSNVIEEVKKRALDRGAVPESISIQTEFVKERTLLRAIATGNLELDIGKNNRKEINETEASSIACSILDSKQVQPILNMKNYFGFTCETIKKHFFVKKRKNPIVILDKFGRIRLMLDNAKIVSGNKKIKNELDTMIHQLMAKSNEELAPQIHILDDMKIVDFSSLTSPEHLIDALKNEINKTNTDKITIIIKL